MARAKRPSTYISRLAVTAEEIDLALSLRDRVFRPDGYTLDRDEFDARCEHVLIQRREDLAVVACFRYYVIQTPVDIDGCYSAQFYDLSALRTFNHPMIELGRFCVDSAVRDPDVLRVAWGAVADIVQARKAELMFGCSSFQGTDERRYLDAFAILRDRHIAPSQWRPRVKAPKVFEFARRLRRKGDPKAAMRVMPPLLKTYLAMGGWVSDHAVVDRDLNTLHVFTGVSVKDIPAARRRSILAAT